MSPIGNMIVIGVLVKPRPMKIVPFEEIAEAHGDWVTTSAEFPKSGVLRKEPEPRGM